MPKRILYVVDEPGWIQEARLEELRRRIDDVELELVSADRFRRRWRLGRYRRRPVYFATWRILRTFGRRYGLRFRPEELASFMTSVTSHYNLGGGLAPEKAIAPGEFERESFEDAVSLLRDCAVVTVNSTPLHELLAGHIPGLLYAPNGVDTEFFAPAGRDETYADRVRVGWVGRVKAAKNVETLRAVATPVAQAGVEVELLAVGKDEERPRTRSEMRDFYRGLDYYLCASWHEGTPNPALEAAACGVPLVTTRVGNMPDLVRHGENGFFVEPTADSIAAMLRTLAALPREEHARLRTAIRADVVRDWSWERNAERYREALLLLLEHASR